MALHVIGRLQREIDLSNGYKGLLASLFTLKELARVTAEVIDTMEGIKTDKYQLSRTDINAYVTAVTEGLQTFAPTPEQVDLISQLIVSFEANPSSWMLQGSAGPDNLHLQFKAMYDEVLLGLGDAEIPVYLPHRDEVGKLSELPQFFASVAPDSPDYAAWADNFASTATLHRLAAVKIIDHVYSLLMDREIWYKFVSPRTKAELGATLERSKGLKLLALHIHALFSYNQFFMLETFLQGYETVQKWITHFPPLEASTLFKLDNIIRPNDLLAAKNDVAEIWASFATTDASSLADSLTIFPAELLAQMGLKNTVAKLEKKASEYSAISPLADLTQLDKAEYLPLFAGVAAGNFDVAADVVNTLLIGKKVSNEIETALAGITPALVRGASKLTISDYKALNVKTLIPFKLPTSLSLIVDRGVVKGVEGGKFSLDSNAPTYSADYHDFIRQNLVFKTFTDDVVVNMYKKFNLPFAFDYDKARFLTSIIDIKYKTLIPSFIGDATTIYSAETLRADKLNLRSFIEELTGAHYDTFIRELALPHIRAIWATYLSSAAILYVDEASMDYKDPAYMQKKVDTSSLKMVTGHGTPYGISYHALSSAQPKLKPDELASVLVPVASGVYLRMLEVVPLPSDNIAIDRSFYQQHPVFFFTGSDKYIAVDKFVIGDGLLNFSVIPVSEVGERPSMVYTNKFAYLTRGLYTNIEPFYKPGAPAEAREVMTLPVKEMDWPYRRHDYFLKYITFGPYSTASNVSAEMDIAGSVTEAVKKIEVKMQQDNAEQAASVNNAGEASRKVASNMTAAASQAANQFRPDGDKPAGLVSEKPGSKTGGQRNGKKSNNQSGSGKKKLAFKNVKNADVDPELQDDGTSDAAGADRS
jgi:hypothetical protein